MGFLIRIIHATHCSEERKKDKFKVQQSIAQRCKITLNPPPKKKNPMSFSPQREVKTIIPPSPPKTPNMSTQQRPKNSCRHLKPSPPLCQFRRAQLGTRWSERGFGRGMLGEGGGGAAALMVGLESGVG